MSRHPLVQFIGLAFARERDVDGELQLGGRVDGPLDRADDIELRRLARRVAQRH
ncbi:MAG TPA: hypothetical protein VME19_00585 [Streptosporangiaceae bacterium]|nr:hypothetical protein [Streptosporangiaceae bacterium]